ncbi:MAG: hypothetical protein ACLFP1_06125 [Candidatus Goldiibacteriota bacterium]
MPSKIKSGNFSALKFFALYAVAASVLFFLVMFFYSGKSLSAPLDDAFIYFQYAKNTAQGNFFEYVKGEGYSSGATSFLYVFMLVPFALFLKGGALIIAAYIIAGTALFFTGYFVYLAAKQLTGSGFWGFAAGLFFVTNGNILWGYFSGMEIAVFTALIVISFYYLMQEGRTKHQIVSLSLLALARPEGFGLALILAGLKLINRLFDKKTPVLRFLMPVAAGFSYFLVNFIFTGDFMPNTMRAKSNFSLYYFSYTDMIAQGWGLYFDFLKKIFNGGELHYFLPLSFFIFCIGLLPGAAKEARAKKAGPYITGFFWFFLGVMSTVFSSFATVHNYRYTMPFTVIFAVFFVCGLSALASLLKFGSKNEGKIFSRALVSFFLLFNIFTVAANAVNFGRDCRDINSQSIAAGRWLKENIKEDALIAINDAGAIAYYSEKRVFDLVGLVTNGQAEVFQNGRPGVFEKIEKVKPDYFMIHIGWFNYEPYTLLGSRLVEFNIKREPPYYVVGSPEVCVPLDETLLGSGNNIIIKELIKGYRLKGRLDVCSLQSEEEKDYRIWVKYVSEYPGVVMNENAYGPENTPVLDAGRITSGGEEFTADNLEKGKPLRIIRRTFNAPQNKIAVFIDGKKTGVWETPETKEFYEYAFDIPAEFIKNEQVRVRLEVESRNRYNTYHYWFAQKETDL